MSESNNIDELLTNKQPTSKPDVPESTDPMPEPESDDAFEVKENPTKQAKEPEEKKEDKQKDQKPKEEPQDEDIYGLESEDESKSSDANLDEYGNEKQPQKTYTEDEVNQRINEAVRERLARLERNSNPNTQQQMAEQTQEEFNYDPNSKQTWQQQLEQFVESTVNKMSVKQAEKERQVHEQRQHQEYERKFHDGMKRFKDFHKIVGEQPITDHMVKATYGMKDPAAFFYAASKRCPEELQRIAQIPGQYAQGLELGRLEERMRKQKTATRAPRPLEKTKEDASMPTKEEKGNSMDDLLSQADAKRMNQMRDRRR